MQDAALLGGSFGEGAVGAAFGLPRTVGPAQTRFASPPRGPGYRPLDPETEALQRIADNNRTGAPWSELRKAYQQARGQVDFAHSEAEVKLNSAGNLVYAKGGHFSTSPNVHMVPGTVQVGSNGSIRANVELRGADGNFYLKTNSPGGRSSLTPDAWSLARAKGEMSSAFLNRIPGGDGFAYGISSGVQFKFIPPNGADCSSVARLPSVPTMR